MNFITGSFYKVKHLLLNWNSLPTWTPNYNGAEYGVLDNEWVPSGINSTFEFKVSVSALNRDDYIVDSVNNASGYMKKTLTNFLQFSVINNVKVDGVPHISDDYLFNTTNVILTITGDMPTGVGVKWIGVAASLVQHLKGQIHSIKLTDPDTPANSLFINSIITQDSMPNESRIFNELTGLQIGSYTLNGTTPYIKVIT